MVGVNRSQDVFSVSQQEQIRKQEESQLGKEEQEQAKQQQEGVYIKYLALAKAQGFV